VARPLRLGLTVPQVANQTGYTERAVKLWITSGRLKSIKIGTSRVILARDLARFLTA
jgi:excisionase family DNA binding protein